MEKRLTELTKTSGWAAKVGPDLLTQVLRHIPRESNEHLIVGLDTSDDGAVYKISEELALVQTLDFFTPVVDDPYVFGQIAATNSLSDIYAMGGEPKMAMNIACFPDCLSPDTLAEILKGGLDKVKEAGAIIVGGHTVSDDEPKYGLSVTGFVHPDKVLSNSNAKVGDLLILTKPVGLGIINTVIKANMLEKDYYDLAIESMITLNKYGKEAVDKIGGVNSMTDITGFGLLGHLLEMAKGSEISMKIASDQVPIIDGAIKYAEMGFVPKGAYDNKAYIERDLEFVSEVEESIRDIMYDPQTSGGLLISVEENKAAELLEELNKLEIKSKIIGQVIEKSAKYIYIE